VVILINFLSDMTHKIKCIIHFLLITGNQPLILPISALPILYVVPCPPG
jgi:hypothetical protein